MQISEDEHRRFVRGELAKIADCAKWAMIWLAITAVATSLIAAILYRRFY